MRGKVLLALFVLCLIVGTVSADTLIVYPSYNAYLARGTDGSWASIHDGAGELISSGASEAYYIGTSATQWSAITRLGFVFDTSGIAANYTHANVTNVTYYSKLKVGSNTFATDFDTSLVKFEPANYTSIAISDYSNFGTKIAEDLGTYGGTETFVGINLNSDGFSYINQGGYTGIGQVVDWDAENSPPAFQASKSAYGEIYLIASGAKKPYLVIEYEAAADTTSPVSITGLGNTTTCNSINWTWEDSISEDADVVQIWQNDEFRHNVSSDQEYDLWEGLDALTEYTFSSHTCDQAGNCNETWVNQTAETGSCETPVITVTGIDPDHGVNNTQVHVIVTGTNFISSNVYGGLLENTTFETDTFGTNLTINNETSLELDFNLISGVDYLDNPVPVQAGKYDLILLNSGDTYYGFGLFTVTPPDYGLAPVADFSTNKSGSICAGEYIQFTDESTNVPTIWYWEFGDGNTSTEQNPVFQYNAAGLFTVNLDASNAYGNDAENKPDYINVTACPEPTPTPSAVCFNQTGNITISLESRSQSSMKWNWNATENITVLSVDSIFRYFDPAVGNFTVTGFLPSSYHTIRISNATDFGMLNCTTNATPPAPWQPEIMPSTEWNAKPENLLSFWWVIPVLIVIWLLFRRG